VGVCTLVGFILGFLAGRPRTTVSTYDKNGPQDYPEDRQKDDRPKNGLSDEDRDYIR
jgi:putative membrane protein